MTEFVASLPFFHFLRPSWLLLIPLAVLLWWRIRRRTADRQSQNESLAPHLAAALTVGGTGRRRFVVADGFLAIVVLISLAAAGPAWNRMASPFVAQTAPLAIVLKVSESMLASDVAPSKLERAKHKILDIIAGRAGGRTALIAYAGSAHNVVPMTEDPEVLKPFVEGLSPAVMPSKGRNASAALELARAALSAEEMTGAILFVLDDLDPADRPAFESLAAEAAPRVIFLSVSRDGTLLNDVSGLPRAETVQLTHDRTDVGEVERSLASAYRKAIAEDGRQQWEDRGWIFAWPAALLLLFWFRRGWAMRWAIALAVLSSGLPGNPARAEGIVDWFLTADQQGRLAFESKDFAAAGARFESPLWRGYALYRAGKYPEAIEVLARLSTAEAAFIQGLAHLKSRGYRPGITAFETALKRDPNNAAAERNLKIARAILAYVERTRAQSGTEEGSEGADDVVFDKEAEGGAETRIEGKVAAKIESAEQWMRAVDTRTEDFLRIRFALEAARARQ